MRSALAAAAQHRAGRSRSSSLSAVPPAETSKRYLPESAAIAASILYRSPLPSKEGRPVYILNAAALPDAFLVDFDSLLPYVLARLPGEYDLLSGTEYEIIFFAGGQPDGPTAEKKAGPGVNWYLQAYHLLRRATRKQLQRLYIVHPRTWVRVMIGVFGTIVSPKFRRKIVHVNTLSQLALQVPIDNLLIPPAVYLHDRKLSPDIDVPYASGRRAFGSRHPLPRNLSTGKTRLPRVLRETSSFVLLPANVGTEGLFRIPPHSTLSGVLREAYDRGQKYIVWKERSATLVQPGLGQQLLDEVRSEDGYGVHLAAGLIKSWYRELREPVFAESSYEPLRQRYSSPYTEVTPEDLVDLILPISPTSSLTTTAREILTRHLLPFLSAVAAHEPQNKMSAENLAICFSMCLVRGPDELEDAMMSSIIKRVIQAAIESWPQLRIGMGIDVNALEMDLQAPNDPRDYEDPLEARSSRRSSEDDVIEGREGRRIEMDDNEEKPKTEKAPTLPPRPRTASVGKKLLTLDVATLTSPLKRKPTPHNATASAPPVLGPVDVFPATDPPKYSTMFGADGNMLKVADSPISYSSPIDGSSPTGTEEDRKGSEREGFLSSAPPTYPQPTVSMPKRKALSTESRSNTPSTSTTATRNTSDGSFRSTSDSSSMLPKAAAQKAAEGLALRLAAPTASSTNTDAGMTVQSSESVLSDGDGLFRKPLRAASATRQQPSGQSFAKPQLPSRQSYPLPVTSHPGNGTSLNTPIMPNPRTPSPSLLKRMSEMEGANQSAKPALQPQEVNPRKASVDDLRRLYEERASTVQSLAQADAARRGSSQS